MTASQSSGFMRRSSVSRVMPALFTRMRDCALLRLDVGDRRVAGGAIRNVERDAAARDAGGLQRRFDRRDAQGRLSPCR